MLSYQILTKFTHGISSMKFGKSSDSALSLLVKLSGKKPYINNEAPIKIDNTKYVKIHFSPKFIIH